MCMYNLSLNEELVRQTRQSFADDSVMRAWLQTQVEALLQEFNTRQTVKKNAREAIAAMRRHSEQNGNSEMSLNEINAEIRQARQAQL